MNIIEIDRPNTKNWRNKAIIRWKF